MVKRQSGYGPVTGLLLRVNCDWCTFWKQRFTLICLHGRLGLFCFALFVGKGRLRWDTENAQMCSLVFFRILELLVSAICIHFLAVIMMENDIRTQPPHYESQLLGIGKAIEVGVDGIIVSNHGGRQLDCAPAAISTLEEGCIFASSVCAF
ncbi:S-2-hydroxy-acid oxidase [Nymphaea thermarum]|nr:S-2-hydroxy-acid oxidase [Nymphaea thermarum]